MIIGNKITEQNEVRCRIIYCVILFIILNGQTKKLTKKKKNKKKTKKKKNFFLSSVLSLVHCKVYLISQATEIYQ
jgi:hypothetical protein